MRSEKKKTENKVQCPNCMGTGQTFNGISQTTCRECNGEKKIDLSKQIDEYGEPEIWQTQK